MLPGIAAEGRNVPNKIWTGCARIIKGTGGGRRRGDAGLSQGLPVELAVLRGDFLSHTLIHTHISTVQISKCQVCYVRRLGQVIECQPLFLLLLHSNQAAN